MYKRVPHLAILAVAIAMVLGGGFWSQDTDQTPVMSGGTDNIQFVNSALFMEAEPEQQPVPNTSRLLASSAESVMGEYLSTSSLSVTSQQLGIETYVIRRGQTISSVANNTGRSEETPLWANDYHDPNQALASGTQMQGQPITIPDGTPPAPPEPTLDVDGMDDADDSDDVEIDDAEAPTVAEEPEVDYFSESVGRSPPEPTEPSDASPSGTGEFEWPTTGVITQYFHSAHNGWDIANLPGTEIRAADNGRVIVSGWNNYGLGYTVSIDHGNGYQTWYGHMEEHPPVEVGQAVEKGEYIGPMGSTGVSTGPHVHFVIAYNGSYQDPGKYLR